MAKELIIGILNGIVILGIMIFVFYDAYGKKRFSLSSSIFWALGAALIPCFMGIPLYYLARPNADCKNCMGKVEKQNYCQSCSDFINRKYRVLNKMLGVFLFIFFLPVIFIAVKVAPTFKEIYNSFDTSIPAITEFVVNPAFAVILTLLFVIGAYLLINKRANNFLKEHAPRSYFILIVLIMIIPSVLVGFIVLSLFLPILNITQIL